MPKCKECGLELVEQSENMKMGNHDITKISTKKYYSCKCSNHKVEFIYDEKGELIENKED